MNGVEEKEEVRMACRFLGSMLPVKVVTAEGTDIKK